MRNPARMNRNAASASGSRRTARPCRSADNGSPAPAGRKRGAMSDRLQQPCSLSMRRRRKRKEQLAPSSMAGGRMRPRAPNIDAGEQEYPHHVNEMPIPGGELEAEMLCRREVTQIDADQADDQECRTNDDVEAMEARRHEERC